MNFRKLFVGSPGNEDSITKTAKVPQSVQAVFLSFFFLFFFTTSLSLSRIYLSRIVEKVPKNLSSYAPDQDEGNNATREHQLVE